MDHSVLNSNDFHKSMSVSTNMNDLHLDHRYFISCAGCDITKDARVNLLYEIPLTLLARRFIAEDGGHFNKLKILIHELNGCIVGPGLYQEWTHYIHASRNKHEQNLELCRSNTNNMLYYRATKLIKKDDQLLAWYSSSVEEELARAILNQESIVGYSSNNNETQCKHCHINFEYPNILKSHLLLDFCKQRTLLEHNESITYNHSENNYNNRQIIKCFKNKSGINQKLTTQQALTISSSSCSTTSSCSSIHSPKMVEVKHEAKETNSAFSPIFNHQKTPRPKPSFRSDIDMPSFGHSTMPLLKKIDNISSSRSSTSTSSSLSCSPVDTTNSQHVDFSNVNTIKDSKKIFSNHRVESYIKEMNQQQSTSMHSFNYEASEADEIRKLNKIKQEKICNESSKKLPKFTESYVDKNAMKNGMDWKITMLDGTQTVELNMSDELGKQKKTHVCLFCGKIYNRKYGLKIHLRTHTGYKPLKCKVCSRPFSDPSNLNKHVRLHSQGDTPYRCPYCGKILVRKRDLDRHIMSRHPDKDITDLELDNGKFDNNDLIDSSSTDCEQETDIEGLDDENERSNVNDMFRNQASFYSRIPIRSLNGSHSDISIQKIIESSQ